MVERSWSPGTCLSWSVCLAEVAAAISGANKTLPIAAAQAGATGTAPWLERLIMACHFVPAFFLIVAWIVLLWSAFTARDVETANP
jgi:(hydroxyamino)benzene mutase